MPRISRIVSLSLLLSCSLLLLSCSFAPKVETVAAQWTVLGSIEWPAAQTAFVVAREATGAHRVIVGAHHLVQIARSDDGSIVRTYREEPCVLYIDEDNDRVLSPKDRRWKMPADHSCPVAQAALTIRVDIDESRKTINLTVDGPKQNGPVPASFRAALDPHTVQQSQLPGIP